MPENTQTYPSILYLSPDAETAEIPEYVFDDVRLTALLPERVVAVMRRPCGAGDIAARREILRSLEKQEFRDAFAVLDRALVSVAHSSEFLATARSDNERYALFAAYARESAAFMRTAASITSGAAGGGGELITRFSDYFKRITGGERFASLMKKIAQADEALAVISEYRMRVSENSSAINKADLPLVKPKPDKPSAINGSRAYYDIVYDAAAALGISDLPGPAKQQSRMSVAFTDGVAKLFPEPFSRLRSLFIEFRALLTDDILFYRGELAFYLSLYELRERVAAAGIPMVYPEISDEPRFTCTDVYDISLLARGETEIIPNDVDLSGGDAFCFLVGANGGGKTTYIRTVGITALLFLSGSAIPARSGSIFPFRRVWTHFTADERFEDSGRLLDEVNRMKPILDDAASDTLVLLNETYSGTDERRANELTRETTEKLRGAGAFGVFVTHFHDVADMGVCMLSAVIDPSADNKRLYKIVKQNAVKSSFAADILRKYGLCRDGLEKRLAERGYAL